MFASDKNLIGTGPEGEHHTNFKLSREGDFLALVQPDGVTVASSYAPQYPPQFGDISYGISTNLSATGFFTHPTPGSPNGDSPLADPERNIVISEIMYHPASQVVEDEYLEIFNAGLEPVELASWRIQGGVDFVFPTVSIQPQQYLVIAADRELFSSNYPNIDALVGGWSGRLSNSGERLELVDEFGQLVDSITYADEGDWSARQRGPLDHGARGWIMVRLTRWRRPFARVNRYFGSQSVQDKTGRRAAKQGGRPGLPNSVARINSPPLILEALHSPIIPSSSDAVLVTARIVDELSTDLSAQVWWRVDGTMDFTRAPMRDDGQAGDVLRQDGIYSARIPPQSPDAIVEFYLEAVDVENVARQWPAPTLDEGTGHKFAISSRRYVSG